MGAPNHITECRITSNYIAGIIIDNMKQNQLGTDKLHGIEVLKIVL